MPPASAMATTAPRIRQKEQLQRRIDLKPPASIASNFTAPQWHRPDLMMVSFGIETCPAVDDCCPSVASGNGGKASNLLALLPSRGGGRPQLRIFAFTTLGNMDVTKRTATFQRLSS